MRELVIPEAAHEGKNSQEFIRFWVVDGIEHISLHIGAMGDREIKQWGMMLADLSVHIIRALEQDGAKLTKSELRRKLEEAYLARLKNLKIDHSGGIRETKH